MRASTEEVLPPTISLNHHVITAFDFGEIGVPAPLPATPPEPAVRSRGRVRGTSGTASGSL
jgi:hypothetical protein